MIIGTVFVQLDTSAFRTSLLTIELYERLPSVSIINDLLGGRGWWLVKGALVRGPFLLPLIN